MFRARKSEARGFTLIELAVVVLILAIIAAIAMPTFQRVRERAADTTAVAALRSALPMAVDYHLNNGSSFDDFDGAGENADWPAQVSVEYASGHIACLVNAGNASAAQDAILVIAQEQTADLAENDNQGPFTAAYIVASADNPCTAPGADAASIGDFVDATEPFAEINGDLQVTPTTVGG